LSKVTTVRQLRDRYGVKASAEATARAKEQAQITRKITRATAASPKTIPEIAKEAELDLRMATWYVLTMTRHKKLRAVEKTPEGYWRYVRMVEED
jgi:Mg-chelatase subunit ChlI